MSHRGSSGRAAAGRRSSRSSASAENVDPRLSRPIVDATSFGASSAQHLLCAPAFRGWFRADLTPDSTPFAVAVYDDPNNFRASKRADGKIVLERCARPRPRCGAAAAHCSLLSSHARAAAAAAAEVARW